MTDYFEEVKKIMSKQFSILGEDIEEESSLVNLGLTDLELEDLVAILEEKYDIQIPQETISSFKKISDIVNYLYEKGDLSS